MLNHLQQKQVELLFQNLGMWWLVPNTISHQNANAHEKHTSQGQACISNNIPCGTGHACINPIPLLFHNVHSPNTDLNVLQRTIRVCTLQEHHRSKLKLVFCLNFKSTKWFHQTQSQGELNGILASLPFGCVYKGKKKIMWETNKHFWDV